MAATTRRDSRHANEIERKRREATKLAGSAMTIKES